MMTCKPEASSKTSRRRRRGRARVLSIGTVAAMAAGLLISGPSPASAQSASVIARFSAPAVAQGTYPAVTEAFEGAELRLPIELSVGRAHIDLHFTVTWHDATDSWTGGDVAAPGATGYGTIRRGATSGVVVIPTIDDDRLEPYEYATARLAFAGSASGVRVDPILGDARVRIADNEAVRIVMGADHVVVSTDLGSGVSGLAGGRWGFTGAIETRLRYVTNTTHSISLQSSHNGATTHGGSLADFSWLAVKRPPGHWHPFSFQAGSACVFFADDLGSVTPPSDLGSCSTSVAGTQINTMVFEESQRRHSLARGESTDIRFKLARDPGRDIRVRFEPQYTSNSESLTVSPSELTIGRGQWNQWHTVKVTANQIDGVTSGEGASVRFWAADFVGRSTDAEGNRINVHNAEAWIPTIPGSGNSYWTAQVYILPAASTPAVEWRNGVAPPQGTLFIAQGATKTYQFRTTQPITSTDAADQPRIYQDQDPEAGPVYISFSGPGRDGWRTMTIKANRVSAAREAFCSDPWIIAPASRDDCMGLGQVHRKSMRVAGQYRRDIHVSPTAGAAEPGDRNKVIVTGAPQVGQVLTADTSELALLDDSKSDVLSTSYQWVHDNGTTTWGDKTDISGATQSTYTVTASDRGERLRVQVTFSIDYNHGGTPDPGVDWKDGNHDGNEDYTIVEYSLPTAMVPPLGQGSPVSNSPPAQNPPPSTQESPPPPGQDPPPPGKRWEWWLPFGIELAPPPPPSQGSPPPPPPSQGSPPPPPASEGIDSGIDSDAGYKIKKAVPFPG